MPIALSLLDLAYIAPGQSARDSFADSVALAQRAEQVGLRRVWYAEHHGMPEIASSATSVLIAHIAAHTSTIRVGSGGIMLPNHSPLVIAEQFGTLASLYPDRIDLGLGRAPGGEPRMLDALRRRPDAADRFLHDVVELQGYLGDESIVQGVRAIPGERTHVPITILGSSLFGAQLAAALGLPFAFASHFAPAQLHQALQVYRSEFEPSATLERPYAIVAANVIASRSLDEALAERDAVMRSRMRRFLRPGITLSDDELDALVVSPQGAPARDMLRRTAIGTPEDVRSWLESFQVETEADEIIVTLPSLSADARLRSLGLLHESGVIAPPEA